MSDSKKSNDSVDKIIEKINSSCVDDIIKDLEESIHSIDVQKVELSNINRGLIHKLETKELIKKYSVELEKETPRLKKAE